MTDRRAPLPPVDLVVLAGGRGERLGGRDKASLQVGGQTLLDRLLAADLGGRVVVVGDTPVPDGVRRVVEEPPGGGPAAGIGAGLDALSGMPSPPAADSSGRAGESHRARSGPAATTWVAVVAVDQPGAAAALAALRQALAEATAEAGPDAGGPDADPDAGAAGPDPDAGAADADADAGGPDALCHLDDEGRAQWLLAIYRRAALEAARERLASERPAGERHTSVRALVAGLRWEHVAAGREHVGDIDTWADLGRWQASPPPA